MIIVGGAAVGALIKLQCPKCGEIQARARGPADATYACRRCGKPLTTADAVKALNTPK